MTRTVTAFFDSRAEAEAARDRLSASNIDASRVRILDQSAAGGSSGTSGSSGETEGGFWDSLKNAFMPEEDHYAYSEGMRRGGYLLTAEVSESEADQACSVLEQSGSVDFEERQEQWRGDGWAGFAGDGQSKAGLGSGVSGMGAMTSGYSDERTNLSDTSLTGTGRTGQTVAEEHIPIVDEQLKVGKREYERGGARVRSYIREVPVHEQVSLHEEHVSVERRPVNQTLGRNDLASGDLLRDRTIEMTETAEEAVVGKEARVTEEVVVRKTAEDRVENIDDTVRHTEVDIDEGQRGTSDRGAFFDRDREGVDPNAMGSRDPAFGDIAGTDRNNR